MDEGAAVFILSFDLGTTGLKSCLYRFDHPGPDVRPGTKPGKGSLTLVAAAASKYGLYIGSRGEAEQNPQDWWAAMAAGARETTGKAGVPVEVIAGISFCSQMQALILVDSAGSVLRPAMSYMDKRADAEKEDFGGRLPRIAGLGVDILLPSLAIAGGAAASVKDPVWKYRWVERNEPEVFRKTYRWLDAKEYLIARATGRFTMSRDSAYATFLMDSRKGRAAWSPFLVKAHGVRMEHLPEIVRSTDRVGGLTAKAAKELGLAEGTAVFSGGGDASLIGVGAGAVRPGDTHIYIGTSGWVSTVTDRRIVDTKRMIASVVGAREGLYNYFAEQETSGKCLEWVRDHLALDEIGVYLDKQELKSGPDEEWKSLIDYLCATIEREKVGSGGVIFTPWLHGNRCPDEDPSARGMFFNIGIETGKRALIRAVVEGIAFNKRLLIEAQEHKLRVSDRIRFAGGGALSDALCKILSDVTGRTIEAIEEPQNAGAAGAALVVAVGLGLVDSLDEARDLVRVRKVFESDGSTHGAYEKNYEVFRQLYGANRRLFMALNG